MTAPASQPLLVEDLPPCACCEGQGCEACQDVVIRAAWDDQRLYSVSIYVGTPTGEGPADDLNRRPIRKTVGNEAGLASEGVTPEASAKELAREVLRHLQLMHRLKFDLKRSGLTADQWMVKPEAKALMRAARDQDQLIRTKWPFGGK